MHTVAVIIRTKDRPHFLARALANVSAQSFKDYTLILINDGGDAQQVEEILAQGPTFPSLQIIHNPQSLGMEAASNQGIRASQSTYIAIHDDDDFWEDDFLKVTVEALESSGQQMVTVRTMEYFERLKEDGSFEHLESRPFWGILSDITFQDITRTNRAVPISILHRRSLHQELGYYREDLPVVGDWEFNLRVGARYPILFIDQHLANWSKRPEAEGAQANSVHASGKLHTIYDGQVRAQAIRQDLAQGGNLGPYLFQAHLANQVDGSVGHSIDLLHQVLQQLDSLEARLDSLQESNQKIIEQLNRPEEKKGAIYRLLRRLKGKQ